MRLASRTIVTAMFLALAGAAAAGPFDDAGAAFNRGDYATALQLWRPLAEDGDAKAQATLGVMYENALGVPQDYPEAAKCTASLQVGATPPRRTISAQSTTREMAWRRTTLRRSNGTARPRTKASPKRRPI